MNMSKLAASLAVALWAGATLAGTYGWNTGSGTWDASSANWNGTGTQWVDGSGNDSYFTNTASATTIAVSGARTAGTVRVGNGSNNANFTFTNGTLSASTIVVVGKSTNGQGAGASTPTGFSSNLTVNTSGNVVIGHWTLAIGGSSIVNAAGVIGGSYSGIDGTWGYLTIKDSAVVTATGGVDGNNLAWSLNLNGGTLITKSIRASDRESGGAARLTFNGTVIKPTQDTNTFVTLSYDVSTTSSALIGNGGAIFDTNGKNIGVKINLKQSGNGGVTKFGAGTLTLSGTNTYSGATVVSNGTLKVGAQSLPAGTAVTIAETAALDLMGSTQTVSSLSGKGTVSNGTLTATGLIQPGGTNTLGTLTVPAGTVLTGKLLVDVVDGDTNDVLAVLGSVDVSAATLAVASGASLNSGSVYTVLTCTGTPPHFASFTAPDGWTLRYVDGAVRLVASSAVTYSWNTGNGTWDTTSANWQGAGTTWVDNGDAFFTNTAAATTITVAGPRLADTVKVGNGSNNAAFTFSGGPLLTSSLLVQGDPANSKSTANTGVTTLDNLSLTNTGNITVGAWTLAVGGSSSVTVGGVVGGSVWGSLTIKDSAVATVPNGVYSTAEAWALNLNGGTLVTKSIRASDRETAGSESRLTFNGTTVKPTQGTNDFVRVSYNSFSTSSALIGNGGAVFDTDGKDITVNITLKAAGSGGLTKLGAGTLTLTATNHTYIGATTIGGGCLAVSSDNTWTGSVPIANASFETYDPPALIPVVDLGSGYRFAPTGANWAFSGQGGITTSNTYFLLPNPSSDGACAAMLYENSTVSQTITNGAAGLYDLRFMAWKGRNYNFNSLVVKIDGVPVCSYPAATISDDVFRILEAKSLTLTAGAHVLLFQGLDPLVPVNSKYPATVIDRVTLTPAAGGSLPSGTAVSLAAAGASYVQGRSSQTIGSLAGVAGSSVSNSGILTVGGSNTNTTFAGVICGPGSLVKSGTGTLTLSGANSYTGLTTVAAGTLEITSSDTWPTNAALEIATGGVVKLSNASEQQVATLTINGVPQYRGTWGSPASEAEHKRAQFDGTGVLRVLSGLVAPGTLLMLN